MSDLLAEAILDAETIKKVALKNAQDAVLERFAPEVKKTLNKLLEQDGKLDQVPGQNEEDPLAGLGGDLGGDLGQDEPDITLDVGDAGPEGVEPSNALKNIPLAATENEKLCPCPD